MDELVLSVSTRTVAEEEAEATLGVGEEGGTTDDDIFIQGSANVLK